MAFCPCSRKSRRSAQMTSSLSLLREPRSRPAGLPTRSGTPKWRPTDSRTFGGIDDDGGRQVLAASYSSPHDAAPPSITSPQTTARASSACALVARSQYRPPSSAGSACAWTIAFRGTALREPGARQVLPSSHPGARSQPLEPPSRSSGNKLVQQAKLFRSQFSDQEIHAGRIAARPTVAGNETKRHRVLGDAEDNWDCLGCRLGRQRGSFASSRGDHVDPLANQLSR